MSGANETLARAAAALVAPRLLRVATFASFVLLGAACGKSGAPDIRGYEPLANEPPSETAPLESPKKDETPVEFYFYINGDNDILGIREDGAEAGRAENQGELLYEQLVRDAGSLPNGVGLHIYLDRGAEIRKGDEMSSETYDFCAGSSLSWPSEPRGETDSRDPAHLKRLLAKTCAVDSKKFIIFWSHGEGYRVQKDFDYHPGVQTAPVLGNFHISQLLDAIPDGYAEAILFDSCSMASLEIASLLTSKARYLLSSQFELPNDGLQYESTWRLLASHRDSRTLLREIRAASESRFNKIGISSPLVIVNLERIADLEMSFHAVLSRSIPANTGAFAEFQNSVLRGEKDADLLFLMQKYGTAEAGLAGDLGILRAALDQGRGSLHFALPNDLESSDPLDSDLERVAVAVPQLFRNWSEKFPNWSLHEKMRGPKRSMSPQPTDIQGAFL